MGACKYGVSLPYLQATMHCIVYSALALRLKMEK